MIRLIKSWLIRQRYERLKKRVQKMPPMTPEEREEQRRSFAYGNVKLSNPEVTREMVDKAADEMRRKRDIDRRSRIVGTIDEATVYWFSSPGRFVSLTFEQGCAAVVLMRSDREKMTPPDVREVRAEDLSLELTRAWEWLKESGETALGEIERLNKLLNEARSCAATWRTRHLGGPPERDIDKLPWEQDEK